MIRTMYTQTQEQYWSVPL